MFQCAAPHQQAAGGQAACLVPERLLWPLHGCTLPLSCFGRAALSAANRLWPETIVLACIIAPAEVMPPHGAYQEQLLVAFSAALKGFCHATCRADCLCRAVRLRQPLGHDSWHCDSSIKAQGEQPGLCYPCLPACHCLTSISLHVTPLAVTPRGWPSHLWQDCASSQQTCCCLRMVLAEPSAPCL